MNLPEEAPPLNPWPFLVGDAALLALAYLIASQAAVPLTGAALIAVVACVALGAVLATIPFLLNHTRRQELALYERQREIAALAQSTATSAEQLSIAASSLHGIADSAARSVKNAESLPHKLQEKINEFKTQLNEVAVTENESLAQEINMLRASETERLETALTAIKKTATDLAMIEAVSRKHISELNDSLGRVASTAEKASADAAAAIAAARSAAEKALAAAHTAAATAIKNSTATALAEIELKVNALADQFASRLEHALSTRPPAHPAAQNRSIHPASTPPIPTEVAPPAPKLAPVVAATPEAPNAPAEHVAPTPTATASAPSFTASSESETESENDSSTAVALLEPRPARKRPPKKHSPPENELSLGLEPQAEYSQVAPEDSAPAVSADGLTRLLVTAYIGIGNKLFVRGEGPGLSWERGVPLQFVSIGRWRWETAEAIDPLQLKIYKNDEFECTAVGVLTLAPGHQREVTATFN